MIKAKARGKHSKEAWNEKKNNMSRSIVQMFFCVIAFKSQLSARVQNTAKKLVKKNHKFWSAKNHKS